jgi:hypothetical protein
VTVGPLGAENLHPAREFLDALRDRDVVGRSANTRELRQGDGFDDAVSSPGRGIEVDLRLVGESDLYYVW